MGVFERRRVENWLTNLGPWVEARIGQTHGHGRQWWLGVSAAAREARGTAQVDQAELVGPMFDGYIRASSVIASVRSGGIARNGGYEVLEPSAVLRASWAETLTTATPARERPPQSATTHKRTGKRRSREPLGAREALQQSVSLAAGGFVALDFETATSSREPCNCLPTHGLLMV